MVIVVVTLVMVVISLVTNMMVDIMVTNMMLVVEMDLFDSDSNDSVDEINDLLIEGVARGDKPLGNILFGVKFCTELPEILVSLLYVILS